MVSFNLASAALFLGTAVSGTLGDDAIDSFAIQTVGGKQTLRGLHRARGHTGMKTKKTGKSKTNKSKSTKGSQRSSDEGDGGNLIACMVNPAVDPDTIDPDFNWRYVIARFSPDNDNMFLQLQLEDPVGLAPDTAYSYYISDSETCVGALTAGPRYDPEACNNMNPWTNVEFTTDSSGWTYKTDLLSNGYDAADNEGYAVFVKENPGDSGVVACGILSPTHYILSAMIMPYNGMLGTKGYVDVDIANDGTFLFSYDLEGLEKECSGCRIFISEEQTCTAAESDLLVSRWESFINDGSDPWTPALGASYTSDEEGNAYGEFFLTNGLGFYENRGYAVVVLDETGTSVIGCGVLKIDVASTC